MGNLAALFSYRLEGKSTVEIPRRVPLLSPLASQSRQNSKKKGHSPARDAWKVALRPKNRYRRNWLLLSVLGIEMGGVVASLGANCSASVEPASAVVDEFPPAITCVTMSK